MSKKNNESTTIFSTQSVFLLCGVMRYSSEHKKNTDSDFYAPLENSLKEFMSPDWNFRWPSWDGVNAFRPKEHVLEYLQSYYYPGFLHTLFPGEVDAYESTHDKILEDQTKRFTLPLDETFTLKFSDRFRNVDMKAKAIFHYMDVFLFPKGIAIFTIRVTFPEQIDHFTIMMRFLRQLGIDKMGENARAIKIVEKDISLRRYFKEKAPGIFNADFRKGKYELKLQGHKLKCFNFVHCVQEMSEETRNKLLYDVGTCSKIGAADGIEKGWEPSEKYFKEMIDKHGISVYSNWSALCLFDSFTVIHESSKAVSQWEDGHFQLYLHSLYVKFYLAMLSDNYLNTNYDAETLEDEFLKFEKYYNLKKITYNFLPQLLYDKIRESLDIETELNVIKHGVEVEYQRVRLRQDRDIGIILLILSGLTIASFVADATQSIQQFVEEPETRAIYYGILLIVLGIFSVVFYKRWKIKREK